MTSKNIKIANNLAKQFMASDIFSQENINYVQLMLSVEVILTSIFVSMHADFSNFEKEEVNRALDGMKQNVLAEFNNKRNDKEDPPAVPADYDARSV